MITTTTPHIEGKSIEQYLGVISAQTIIGANFLRIFLVGLPIFLEAVQVLMKSIGRSQRICHVRVTTKAAGLGANAIVGIDLDFETVGSNGSMLMVIATGTAVKFS